MSILTLHSTFLAARSAAASIITFMRWCQTQRLINRWLWMINTLPVPCHCFYCQRLCISYFSFFQYQKLIQQSEWLIEQQLLAIRRAWQSALHHPGCQLKLYYRLNMSTGSMWVQQLSLSLFQLLSRSSRTNRTRFLCHWISAHWTSEELDCCSIH